MKFTLSWLKEHLKTEATIEQIAFAPRCLSDYGFSPLLQANLATGLS